MRRLFVIAFAFVFFAQPASAAQSSPGDLTATFGATSVTVSGVTRGKSIAIDAAIIETQGGVSTRMSRVEELVADQDGDGVVTFDLHRAIPIRSIWAIVDVESGRRAIATLPGLPRKELPFLEGTIKNAPAADLDQMTHSFFIAQVLWVRPGQGAWLGTTADGGAGDSDGKNNGHTTTPLTYLHPLAGAAPIPKKIKKDDVLIFIDPFELTFTSTQVVK